jgi:DNA recombination protein RmuC
MERWPWFAGAAALLLAYLTGRAAGRRAAGGGGPGADMHLAALDERLSSMGRQQEMLGRSLLALEGVLTNKQARGAFGEAQLERLVADLLPPASFRLQAPLGRNRVDCLIALPWPPGPVPVDAKFPLEAFRLWQEAPSDAEAARALRQLRRDFGGHVEAIRSKYLVPGQTADFALLFLPSEAVFAALHGHCREAVEAAQRARVFPVSPATLWPLLNTLAGVLRDVRFAADTHRMQSAAGSLAEQSAALADLARRTERDWSRLAADLQSLIAAADRLAASGRSFRDGGG